MISSKCTRRRWFPPTNGSFVKTASLCLLFLYMVSVVTILRIWPNTDTDKSNPGLPLSPLLLASSFQNDGSRRLNIQDNNKKKNFRSSNRKGTIHQNDDIQNATMQMVQKLVLASNRTNVDAISLNVWELAEDLLELELSSNSTHVDYLKHTLKKSSKIFRPGSWDGAGIVLADYRLILFTQGKVACTVFKQLARRMMGLADWNIHREPDLPHNPQKNGLTYLYHYPPTVALTMMTSPRWTRAIFVRDPKERVLSAYLDKAAKKDGLYVSRHCCKKQLKVKEEAMMTSNSNASNNDTTTTKVPTATCGERASASFLAFLRLIQNECCCDPHWGKQSNRIEADFRPYINFVGHFDRVQDETRRLLNEVSAKFMRNSAVANANASRDFWQEFGATGWGSTGKDAIFATSTQAKHQTSAMTKLQQYYNNRTVEGVADAIYKSDYDDPLLNFQKVHLHETDQ